ncbi:inorganic diphosphatase [Candidatus Shapirobacteria bacterium]|nr:inorganic diphosphatase [Candidatus Shapirobacteria bacterium]
MFHDIPIGKKAPKTVNTIIEIPTNTKNKFEFDEELGVIKLDRVLHSSVTYPFDYGFIPETRCGDGDHLDVMVITNFPVFPGCLVEVRPIGTLLMEDEHGQDEKVLAVPCHNPAYRHIKTLRQVSPHLLEEIVHFWSTYKLMEKKDKPVKLKGWVGRLATYKLIRDTRKTYQAELKK